MRVKMKSGSALAGFVLALVACGDVQVVKSAPDPCLMCAAPEAPCRELRCSADPGKGRGGDVCGEALAEEGAPCADGAGACNKEGDCIIAEENMVCAVFWEEPSPCTSAGDCHPDTVCSKAVCEDGRCAYVYAPTGISCGGDSHCITGGCCSVQR